jgi:hypothetical protein
MATTPRSSSLEIDSNDSSLILLANLRDSEILISLNPVRRVCRHCSASQRLLEVHPILKHRISDLSSHQPIVLIVRGYVNKGDHATLNFRFGHIGVVDHIGIG